MLNRIIFILLITQIALFSCVKNENSTNQKAFVRVKGTQFLIGDRPYYFMGTNFWYGINLGSEGLGGDRKRLIRELDELQKLGINNLRIVALSEGPDNEPLRMVPAVQTADGSYNEELLKGLDFLLAEMSKRNMYAVVCLGNFWPWSGGMGQYMVWSGDADSIPYPPPYPGGSWDTYQKFTAQFYSKPKAVQKYWDAVKQVVTRVNSVNKLPYSEDPTIMSWQLGNEPRGVNNVNNFNVWIDSTAGLIKSWDKNHLVTVGSEGYTASRDYSGTDFFLNHDGKNIDYTTAHIWVENWSWYNPKKNSETYDSAVFKMKQYMQEHIAAAQKLNKPLVIEEFGIARDSGSFDPVSSSKVRDGYYSTVFEEVYKNAVANTPVAGVNFWAWAGEGRPRNPETLWNAGDQFIGDPPHELQGWYSVYNTDTTTNEIIKVYAAKMSGLNIVTE